MPKLSVEGAAEVELADACVTLFQTLRTGRECELDLVIEPTADASLRATAKAHVLMIVREAISNAVRHGAAMHVWVRLARSQPTRWELSVRDDGCGFDPASLEVVGRGLANIRARADELGGEARWEASTEASGGTRLIVRW